MLNSPGVVQKLSEGTACPQSEAAESGNSTWIYVVNGTTPDSVFAPPEK